MLALAALFFKAASLSGTMEVAPIMRLAQGVQERIKEMLQIVAGAEDDVLTNLQAHLQGTGRRNFSRSLPSQCLERVPGRCDYRILKSDPSIIVPTMSQKCRHLGNSMSADSHSAKGRPPARRFMVASAAGPQRRVGPLHLLVFFGGF